MAEDEHLEAAYEDANGDPHGIGSPEWEEDEDDLEEYDGAHGYPEGEEPDDYLGTYIPKGIEDDPIGRQPGGL